MSDEGVKKFVVKLMTDEAFKTSFMKDRKKTLDLQPELSTQEKSDLSELNVDITIEIRDGLGPLVIHRAPPPTEKLSE